MSSTLTWAISGNCTKTNTTVAAFFDDLDTLISSKSGDATFNWQKAGKNSSSTPYYLLLSRKDASAGRIAIICYTTAATNIQPVLFDQLPVVNNILIAWFPNGTGTTLSNLNATSGTVCGNDTGAVKASGSAAFGSLYAASFVQFYADSYDCMWLGFANPGAATTYAIGAGLLVEDAAGTAYDATAATNGLHNWGAASAAPFAWTATVFNAGASSTSVRVNYGTSKVYYNAWTPFGGWAAVLHTNALDILSDDVNSKVWFAPTPLLGQAKGEGVVLKFRQIGYGTGTTTAFANYTTTGPVVQATQLCNTTAGAAGLPWVTNFKI